MVIRRISEQLQENAELLRVLARQGVRPGAAMQARVVEGTVSLDGQVLPVGVAHHLFVSAVDEDLSPLEVAPLLCAGTTRRVVLTTVGAPLPRV